MNKDCKISPISQTLMVEENETGREKKKLIDEPKLTNVSESRVYMQLFSLIYTQKLKQIKAVSQVCYRKLCVDVKAHYSTF